MMPLKTLLTSAFGLRLGMLGHIVGWPFPRGGAQQITAALVSYLRRLGAELVTNASVATLRRIAPGTGRAAGGWRFGRGGE